MLLLQYLENYIYLEFWYIWGQNKLILYKKWPHLIFDPYLSPHPFKINLVQKYFSFNSIKIGIHVNEPINVALVETNIETLK